ncbi:MAG: hypothetical protein WCX64_06460 [Candidatus Micrarchaeia archaeon]
MSFVLFSLFTSFWNYIFLVILPLFSFVCQYLKRKVYFDDIMRQAHLDGNRLLIFTLLNSNHQEQARLLRNFEVKHNDTADSVQKEVRNWIKFLEEQVKKNFLDEKNIFIWQLLTFLSYTSLFLVGCFLYETYLSFSFPNILFLNDYTFPQVLAYCAFLLLFLVVCLYLFYEIILIKNNKPFRPIVEIQDGSKRYFGLLEKRTDHKIIFQLPWINSLPSVPDNTPESFKIHWQSVELQRTTKMIITIHELLPYKSAQI